MLLLLEVAPDEEAASTHADDLVSAEQSSQPAADGEQSSQAAESIMSPSAATAVADSWPANGDPSQPPEGADAPSQAQDSAKSKRRTRKPVPLGAISFNIELPSPSIELPSPPYHRKAEKCLFYISGIGGFIAKPRQPRGPPKLVVHGPATEDGQPPMLQAEESAAPAADSELPADNSDNAKKKKSRKPRKKGVIEDTYPSYLQVSDLVSQCLLFLHTIIRSKHLSPFSGGILR